MASKFKPRPNIFCSLIMSAKPKDEICFTGMYSKKTGNYTTKQFMDVMNKHYKTECAEYRKSQKCPACKKLNAAGILLRKRYTPKRMENLHKYAKLCIECKKTHSEKDACTTPSQYINFSGAERGRCTQNEFSAGRRKRRHRRTRRIRRK
jgi:hypothetical protein